MARPTTSLEKSLVSICGEDHVFRDADSKDFFASDLYEKGLEPDYVVAPNTPQQVAEIVILARKAKRPVYIRGGGMSYSNTFLPNRKSAIMIDSRRLDKIRDINSDDLYVTVEAGCTWAALDEALQEHDLRAVFWGPFSGGTATIGGSTSQGTANNAAARIGTSDSTVLAYEIVTGAGKVLNTGKNAQAGHVPFFRNYGPDLTSLFSNDAGALGIKTAVTLKLEPRPKAFGGVSFAFDSFEHMLKAVEAAGKTGKAMAIISMDAQTAGIRAGERGLKEDIKKLWSVIRTAHNPFLGLIRGCKIALAGGRVFERAKYTAHFLAEGANNKTLMVAERHLRKTVRGLGDELPSVAISMMRLDNFPDLPLTAMDGRRMLPIHGILPWSSMKVYEQAYHSLIATYETRMEACQVTIADIFTVIGTNGLLCEPVFYWLDSHTHYQRQMTSNEWKQNWPDNPDNPEARALVEEIKTAVIDLWFECGAAHIQIGKQYPYMRGRSEENSTFIKTLKKQLDPDHIINPGALGL